MEDLILKQKAFFDAGNTLDTRSRRAMLQILANTVKELRGGDPDTEGFLAAVADIRKHLYKWSGTGRLRMLMSLFARPANDGPVPHGTVLIDASGADSPGAILTSLACALAAGNTAVVKVSASGPGEAVRRIVDETFTDDFVAVVTGGSENEPALQAADFDYVHVCGPVPCRPKEGFDSFSRLSGD